MSSLSDPRLGRLISELPPWAAAVDWQSYQCGAGGGMQRLAVTSAGHKGKVMLRGTVRCSAERQEAERVGWSAPGVTGGEERDLDPALIVTARPSRSTHRRAGMGCTGHGAPPEPRRRYGSARAASPGCVRGAPRRSAR